MINKGFNNCWPTTILKNNIKDKELLNRIVNYIHLNYINKNITDQNIFEDTFFNLFVDKEILPIFNEYLNFVNIDLKKEKHFLRGTLIGSNIINTIPTHNQYDSHITGLFYILSDEKETGGTLILKDPRFNADRGYHLNKKFKKWFEPEIIKPQTTDVIIFPSFAYNNIDMSYGKIKLIMQVELTLLKDYE